MNCIVLFALSTQVPGVLQRDVSDDLLQELVPSMEKQFPDMTTTSDNLLAFFESRIVGNLHVVLCFSPVSKGLLLFQLFRVEILLK
jgi:dynein heavy chain, axonemal